MADLDDRTELASSLPLTTPEHGSPVGGDRTLRIDSVNLEPSANDRDSPERVPVDPYLGMLLEGRYVVEQRLGEGGMGVVYRGRHKVIDKRVAIKILRVDMAANAEMVERFLNEARAASSIGNPHIVDISDFGRLPDGATFFVMEYLEGQSLAALQFSEKMIPIPRLIHLAKQMARGLAAAHARGIVHRDLKPDNVMVVARGADQDFVKVLDFGIAKVGGEAGRLTRAGSVFGTPHYMSPEQAAGVTVDPRTDIYALGIIMYEMAAGRVPFEADNLMGILTQHMYKAPLPFHAITAPLQNVPTALEAIVLKCLAKKVELRYASMNELAADLERVERGLASLAAEEQTTRRPGFDVPDDYFREREPHDAREPHDRRTRREAGAEAPLARVYDEPKAYAIRIGAFALVSLLVVGGVFSYFHFRNAPGAYLPTAPSGPESSSISVAASARSPLPQAPVPQASVHEPAPKQPLFVSVEPADATIGVDGAPAGVGTVTLNLAAGDSVQVHVEKKGYVPQDLTLEGRAIDPHAPFKRIVLAKEQAASRTPPKPAAAKAIVCPPGQKLDMFGKSCEKPIDP